MEPPTSYVTTAFSDPDSVSVEGAAAGDADADADLEALRRLSDNLAAAFRSPDDFDLFADARIAVPGAADLRLHRCVLSARSPFLRAVFARRASGSGAGVDGHKLELRELLGEEVEVGYEALQLVLDYLYSGRVGDLPKTACVCVDEDGCAHVGCRPAVAFMAQVLFAASTFQVAELTNLFQGARPSDLTFDGRKAVQISKRLTKHGDYSVFTEEGKPSPKDGLCIEILEQAERRDPQFGEASVSLAMAGDSLRGRLLYLENRVALARILFPMEARVAMDIAQVDGTLEFTLGSSANLPPEIRRTTVDLDETPLKMKEEHLDRMKALSKTVELGKRFFPRCSKVLDKIMDDETEPTSLGRDTSIEKKRRFHEMQEVLQKAFSEDKEEFNRSALSSSSSSTSIGAFRPRR